MYAVGSTKAMKSDEGKERKEREARWREDDPEYLKLNLAGFQIFKDSFCDQLRCRPL